MTERSQNIILHKNIAISDYIIEVLKRWYVTAIIVAISLILTVIYTLGFMTPMYASSAKILILSKQSSEHYTSSDFSISTYLSYDFVEIIVDTPILNEVSKDIDGKYSAAHIKQMVSLSQPDNTRIIEIRAETPDAEDSKMIVDSICKNAKEKLVDLMRLDSIEIIREGEVAKNPSSPNLRNNLILTLLFSVSISCIIISINFAFNNKVTSVADIEKYLELNVLASIPYNQSKAKSK